MHICTFLVLNPFTARRAVKEVCTVSDEAFKLPEGYHQVTRSQRNYVDEDEIMQIAIQQSLEEQGGSEQRGSEVCCWVWSNLLLAAF